MNTTFAFLLSQLLDSTGLSAAKAQKQMEEQGITISYPAFAAYKNFSVVPPFDKAQAILRFFEYDISEQDLKDILDNSRSELKKLKLDNQADIRTGIRLTPRSFSKDLEAPELDVMISRRINELFEDNGNMNTYVSYLIKNDLISSGYIQENE